MAYGIIVAFACDATATVHCSLFAPVPLWILLRLYFSFHSLINGSSFKYCLFRVPLNGNSFYVAKSPKNYFTAAFFSSLSFLQFKICFQAKQRYKISENATDMIYLGNNLTLACFAFRDNLLVLVQWHRITCWYP